jgi:hypothetical protein
MEENRQQNQSGRRLSIQADVPTSDSLWGCLKRALGEKRSWGFFVFFSHELNPENFSTSLLSI